MVLTPVIPAQEDYLQFKLSLGNSESIWDTERNRVSKWQQETNN